MSHLSDVQIFLRSFFEADSEVVQPEMGGARFGSRGFKVAGKVFAMEADGTLALKLPSSRVRALTEEGRCLALQMGGRRMKEWVVVNDREIWPELALEAREFAGTMAKALE
jgi:hypothetical protein